MYSWGMGAYGQNGNGEKEDLLLPDKVSYFISNNRKVVNASCGSFHTIAIVSGGFFFFHFFLYILLLIIVIKTKEMIETEDKEEANLIMQSEKMREDFLQALSALKSQLISSTELSSSSSSSSLSSSTSSTASITNSSSSVGNDNNQSKVKVTIKESEENKERRSPTATRISRSYSDPHNKVVAKNNNNNNNNNRLSKQISKPITPSLIDLDNADDPSLLSSQKIKIITNKNIKNKMKDKKDGNNDETNFNQYRSADYDEKDMIELKLLKPIVLSPVSSSSYELAFLLPPSDINTSNNNDNNNNVPPDINNINNDNSVINNMRNDDNNIINNLEIDKGKNRIKNNIKFDFDEEDDIEDDGDDEIDLKSSNDIDKFDDDNNNNDSLPSSLVPSFLLFIYIYVFAFII